MTAFIYMLPLGAGGMRKPWGMSNSSFPCCWGTLTEQFSKLADSIYFASPDQTTVFVNQFVSSTVRWAEQKATIVQDAGFPASTSSTTTITVDVDAAVAFTVNIRVPAWACGSKNAVAVNGKAVDPSTIKAGSYLAITRTWAKGDVVDVHFPMTFWSSKVTDDRAVSDTSNRATPPRSPAPHCACTCSTSAPAVQCPGICPVPRHLSSAMAAV